MRKPVVLAACAVLVLLGVAVWSWSGRMSAESSATTASVPASSTHAPEPTTPLVAEHELASDVSSMPVERVERTTSADAPPTSSDSTYLVLVRDAVTQLPIAGAEIETRAGVHVFTASDGLANVVLDPPDPTADPRQAEVGRKLDRFLRGQEEVRSAADVDARSVPYSFTARHELATVRAAGHLQETIEGWTGEPLPETIVVELVPTRVVHGRVLDSSRVPVAGAEVRLETTVTTRAAKDEELSGEPGYESGYDSVLTDALGRFRFDRISTRATMNLRALHATAGAAVRSLVERPAEELDVDLGDIVLERHAWRIAGVVVTGWLGETEVEPVNGATVQLRVSMLSFRDELVQRRNGSAPLELSEAPRRATTLPNGAFELEDLLPMTYVVELLVDEKPKASATIDLLREHERMDVRLFMPRTTSLRGVVVDADGMPLRGAQVYVGGTSKKPVVTDADGRFEATDLGRKPVRVEVVPTGLARGVLRTKVDGVVPGEREIRIQVPTSAPITGVVLGESGEPVPFAAVTALDANGQEAGFAYAEQDGRFEVFVRQGEAFELVAQPSSQNGKTRSLNRSSQDRAGASNVRAGATDVVLRMKSGG